jgi:Mrp family chromosome partitioning ATPase
MGRMIDILRTADRRPAANAPTIAGPAEQETALEEQEPELPAEAGPLTPDSPPLEDDDEVPFIEVGGKREPALRLIPPPSPLWGEGRGEGSESVAKTLPLTPYASPQREEGGKQSPALLTIRFLPVHAARLGGRGPVAELIAFHEPEHAVSVQYQSLAAEIARQMPGTLPKVLLVVGAAEGVGTSTVLLNLAVTLARQDATVTVVDANLARPALAERLGLPPGPGLREVLAGQMPPAWCLQETVQGNLWVLPAGVGGQPRDGVDAVAIAEKLRERNDCVLIDAGPWTEGGLASRFAGGSDAIYLVMRQESAATAEMSVLQEEILQRSGRLRGCVLTQT